MGLFSLPNVNTKRMAVLRGVDTRRSRENVGDYPIPDAVPDDRIEEYCRRAFGANLDFIGVDRTPEKPLRPVDEEGFRRAVRRAQDAARRCGEHRVSRVRIAGAGRSEVVAYVHPADGLLAYRHGNECFARQVTQTP